jgi:hypothetical protein
MTAPKFRCLLFLDIDGVLNNAEWEKAPKFVRRPNIDPTNVEELNRFCAVARPLIVISSAWRTNETPAQISAKMMRRGFRHPLLVGGETPELPGRPRGDEIIDWIATAREELVSLPLVIFDDRNDMGAARPFLVQTDPQKGLTRADVDRALRLIDAQLEEERKCSTTTPVW